MVPIDHVVLHLRIGIDQELAVARKEMRFRDVLTGERLDRVERRPVRDHDELRAVARLAPGDLRSTATGQSLPLHVIRGADLAAIAAIAEPQSFFKQLTDLGAVVRTFSFPDHHAFTRAEARNLAAEANLRFARG